MEKRWVNVNPVKTGSGIQNFRLNLPLAWIRDLELSEDLRGVKLTYDPKKKQIIIETCPLTDIEAFVKKVIEKYAGQIGRQFSYENSDEKEFKLLSKDELVECLNRPVHRGYVNKSEGILSELRTKAQKSDKVYRTLLEIAKAEYMDYVDNYLLECGVINKDGEYNDDYDYSSGKMTDSSLGRFLDHSEPYSEARKKIELYCVEALENSEGKIKEWLVEYN